MAEEEEFKWYYFMRINALDCTKDDIQAYCQKFIQTSLKSGKFSQVAFGSAQSLSPLDQLNNLKDNGW